MKKTLIALAVLAASGASFAQVTITGAVVSGYRATTDNLANSSSGFGIDTAELYFGVTEDLGGGLKATAKLGFSGTDRGASQTGQAAATGTSATPGTAAAGDTTLALAGGFGTMTLGTTRSTDYLSQGTAGAGAGWDMAGKLFSGRTVRDSIGYKSPELMTGLTVSAAHAENYSNNGLGLGAATGAPAAAAPLAAAIQRYNAYGVAYAAGALKLDAAYIVFDNKNQAVFNDDDNSSRVSGSYDFGVAKLGLGLESRKQVDGTRLDTLVGLTAPLGSKLTVGANVGNRNSTGYTLAANNGTRTGYALTAAYSLSKRTSVGFAYGRWDGAINPSNQNSEASILLGHSF